jgi:hypothetical protein
VRRPTYPLIRWERRLVMYAFGKRYVQYILKGNGLIPFFIKLMFARPTLWVWQLIEKGLEKKALEAFNY